MDPLALELQIEKGLDGAIEFMNSRGPRAQDRDRWCEVLSTHLVQLDGMSNYAKRRETVVAIQNMLTQLDHMFEKQKPVILISTSMHIRESYLPPARDSLYALGRAFN